MDDSTFARLWPLLRLSRRAHLQGWGEPFLHPRFFDLQALAAKAGCKTSTTSCGMVMDEARAARLAACGMDLIAFSLAGTDEASNAARQGIPLARVRQSIDMLHRAIKQAGTGPELHLAYLLLADRMEAARRLPELMEELDVGIAVVSTLDYLACGEHRELAIAPEETVKIETAREILTVAAERAEKAGRVIQYALPGQVQAKEGCRENVGRCLYAAANGDISPCVYLNVPGSDPAEKRRVFGNALDEDPVTIWKKPDYASFRKRLLAGEPDAVCLRCAKRTEQAGQ